ncbi:MAG TPA: hypothetical protein VM054_03340, partial [bacterium]|nr:hypothetical protein [bacterium]
MRTKGLAILIALTLAAGAFANTASPPTTIELIGSAYERGELTYTDYALYKLYLAFGDADRIPDAYRGDNSLAGVCGTMLIYDANMCVLKGLFDESDLADAQLYLGRPTQEGTPGARRGYDIPGPDIHHWDTPEGNFRMWWAGVGPHALWYPEDDNSNGVPDIVELVAEGLEYSLGLFIDDAWLGFDYPVKDGNWYPEGADYGYCDGDTQEDWERFDAYFRSMGEDGMDPGVMAYCQYDYYYEETPEDDASFHMAFRNTVDPDSVSDEEKTTAAHELNHGVQGGIDVDSPTHHKEKTSVWSEERAYPLANDYQQGRIGTFMLKTHVGITRDEDYSWYNGVIWNHYIESLFYEDPALFTYMLNTEQQKDAIPMIWENYEQRTAEGTEYDFNDGYDQLFRKIYPDMEFEDDMGALAYAYGQFVEWNWFTGQRSASRGGNSANNHGFYYIDDLNTTGHSFSNSGFSIDFPSEPTAVAYDLVNDVAPDGTREFTGAQVVSGVEVDMDNENVNIKGCPDGLGSVYMHVLQLGPIPEDMVYAFKGYPDNEEDSKFWGGVYILMQNDARQHSDQTSPDGLSTEMNIFGDKGIIRVYDAAKYSEVAFVPYVRRDVGSDLQFLVRINAVDSSDRDGPSFLPSSGGALQLAVIPGLTSHIEFTATPNERLFACPRYDVHFTEVDDKGVEGDTHYWELNGFQNGDTTFRTWDDGPSIYTAFWTLPDYDGTADIDVTASDLGGNIGTTSFDGILSQADIGDDGGVVGRNAPATLEIPAGAVGPGARVLVMGRPDISGGLLETWALSSAPTDAKVIASPAALGRGLAAAA